MANLKDAAPRNGNLSAFNSVKRIALMVILIKKIRVFHSDCVVIINAGYFFGFSRNLM